MKFENDSIRLDIYALFLLFQAQHKTAPGLQKEGQQTITK